MNFGTQHGPPRQRNQPMERDAPERKDSLSKGVDESPLRRQLLDLYDVLSHKIAGGQRTDHRAMLPGSDDPNEGLVPDEFRPDVTDLGHWFRPEEWLGLHPGDTPIVDMGSLPPAGKGSGRPGKGLDWFRTGEAPDNYTNRKNPLYQARRQFAVAIAPEIERMFGVSAQGSAGHMRQPHPSHAAPGGPSANSDHYSGGAIDFFGSKEDLDALRDWLITQPFTSFVRWQSESHYDHVHASFDLGWVAENYFEGGQVPTFQRPARQQAPTRAPDLPREPSTSPNPGSAARKVL